MRRAALASELMRGKLVQYLRAERRRAALSQTDVAALLGGAWKGRVAWYERGAVPPTEVVLAYEAMIERPVAELLAGTYEEVRNRVRTRARDLLRHVGTPATARQARRYQTLERIAA